MYGLNQAETAENNKLPQVFFPIGGFVQFPMHVENINLMTANRLPGYSVLPG